MKDGIGGEADLRAQSSKTAARRRQFPARHSVFAGGQ